MDIPVRAAVLVAITLTVAACAGVHRVKTTHGSFRGHGPQPLAAPEQPPTKYMCAAAWNRRVPASALVWERRHDVWQASVGSMTGNESTLTWGKGAPTTTTAPREIVGCTIDLLAPHGATMDVTGEWVRGRIATWEPMRHLPSLPGDGNACVARDGTIRPLGSFTARSRCAHPESG